MHAVKTQPEELEPESPREHHDERELADFIRDGARRRPEQAFGDYYQGKNASCALGAAYEAMYRLPLDANGKRPTRDLDWFFDCLDMVRPCPGEGCKKRIFLAAILVHLNDDHRWTREQIAEWLSTAMPPRPKPA
jgi:hypothetical protein